MNITTVFDSQNNFINFVGVGRDVTLRIEKEIELQKIVIIKIENIKIARTLSIISNPECYKSKAFELFYNELCSLKNNTRLNVTT